MRHFKQRDSLMDMNNRVGNESHYLHKMIFNHGLISRYLKRRQKHAPGCLAERETNKKLAQWWKRKRAGNKKRRMMNVE